MYILKYFIEFTTLSPVLFSAVHTSIFSNTFVIHFNLCAYMHACMGTYIVYAYVNVCADLRVRSGDVLVQSLVMVNCVFQILEFRRQLSFTTCLTPWLHFTHVLWKEHTYQDSIRQMYAFHTVPPTTPPALIMDMLTYYSVLIHSYTNIDRY